MFGAFKSSAPLSGGLLWKIPWRLSSTRKLRHRRRLRRVDNVVSVLDTALKKSTSSIQQSQSPEAEAEERLPPSAAGIGATLSDLKQTAEGQRLLTETNTPTSQLTRRHGRGPLQGEYLPAKTSIPAQTPSGQITLQHPTSTLLRDENTIKLIARWKAEMPTEQEMAPRDKYTMFDKKVRGYRKGVHKLPKWTRVSQRVNPPGF